MSQEIIDNLATIILIIAGMFIANYITNLKNKIKELKKESSENLDRSRVSKQINHVQGIFK